MTNRTITKIVCTAAVFGLGITTSAWASSHREAPAIAQDGCADNTDVYAFISPESPDNLVVVANYVPLLLPPSGPNFYSFCDSVAYDIHFDNDGDARTDIKYRFLFNTTIQNGDTFLYNVGPVTGLQDPNLNVRQTYQVIRMEGNNATTVASNVPVAPWNVGSRSFPGTSYDTVALSAVTEVGGTRVFAGPRDEPFFVDLHVFDLLGVGGAPTTDGVNVMSLVLEVPITELAADGIRPAAGDQPTSIIGVHATASRKRKRILRRNQDERNRGRYVQVSRLGWPLVNEVVVPLRDKDKFNRSQPVDDLANIGSYVLFPELPSLLNAVLNAGCAPTPADGRLDIAGLLSPNGTTIADLLRINIAQGQTNTSSGFPNGRALADDVTDTLLTVICNNGGALGDGVDGNDKAFSNTFPYVASPHSGNP
jgi:hypothetical protein